MGAMRLVPALGFCALLGVQVLIPFSAVYGGPCPCGMSCPQYNGRGQVSCYCGCCYPPNPPCAFDDTVEQEVSYNTVFNDRPIEIRRLENRPVITSEPVIASDPVIASAPTIASEPVLNEIPVKVRYVAGSRGRLVTIPVGDLKFQCEHLNRLSEMLSDYQGRY